MNETEFQERLLGLLGTIATALEQIAQANEPDEGPNIQMPLAAFANFDWSTINARVITADDYGPTSVLHNNRTYKRRSPENKYGADIWFSRYLGKDTNGGNLYTILIKFRQPKPEEAVGPISRAAEKELRAAAPALKAAEPPPALPPPPPAEPPAAQAPAASPPATPPPAAPTETPQRHDYKTMSRPFQPAILRDFLRDYASWAEANGHGLDPNSTEWHLTIDLLGRAAGNIAMRDKLLLFAFEAQGAAMLKPAQVYTLAKWLKPFKDADTGEWIPCDAFRQELAAFVTLFKNGNGTRGAANGK